MSISSAFGASYVVPSVGSSIMRRTYHHGRSVQLSWPVVDPSATVTRSDRAIVEDVGGETVLLDLDGDTFLRLNTAGAALWNALDEPRSIEALAGELETAFGVDAQTAVADAAAFVEDMRGRGLLSVG